ncbi:MAG: winged helix DNA-binding domain-containing protein [Actinomycetota bacterium]
MADKDARILTQRELNRALLARQLLLERAKTPLPKALDRIGGIQAQYAPSMYIGLWSRLESFEREQLTRALQRGSVVQGTLMRATIHLVSKGDYWPYAAGIRADQREWWLRVHGRGTDTRELEADARKVRKAMKGNTLGRAELEEVLGKRLGLSGLALDLVRVPPSGTWERRRADLYALAEDRVGPQNATAEEGVEHLVQRYLQGFRPARPTEIADWAGLNISTIRPALDRLGLRRFQDEQGKELLDLPRAPLPDPETPVPVRFLPVWDSTLLVHARGTGILPEQYRARVFNVKTPHSVNTFLVDGQVAGIWRYEKKRVKLEPFGRLSRAVRKELDDESERLASFHA